MQKELVNSTLKFIRYLLLRYENGFPVTKEEERDTYKCYEDFCKSTDLMPLKKTAFYKKMNMLGIMTDRVWDKELEKVISVRDLTKDKLAKAVSAWVDNSTTSVSVVDIDNQKYQTKT